MRVSLDWLKDFVDTKESLDKLQHSLTMTGLEVVSVMDIEEDKVLDIEITPNRPDCLSILGVAREAAAAKNKVLKIPASIKKYYMKKAPSRGSAKIEVLDKKGCPRYVGCVIKNVKVGPSPKWLIARLNAMGVRSVNNVVDITNYVLFETGQPLHAFDLDKLAGKKIVVRRAKKNEGIVTIDGVNRELDTDTLVIADAERPVAIAGIMGGKDTEISSETKNILLESAYFNPIAVRKGQRKIGLASESSYRFERGVDFAMILSASIRAQELIRKIAKGRVAGLVTDVGGKRLKNKEILFDLNENPRVLGVDISPAEVIGLLKRLGLSAVKKGKARILVSIPPYRQDLEKGIDIVEELARLYGYDKIHSKLPVFKMQSSYEEEMSREVALQKEIKNILYSLGLNEIVTYTLTSRFSIEALGIPFDNLARLQNPLSSNQEFMRPTLVSEMLEAVSWNVNRNSSPVQLFELSKVYSLGNDGDGVKERQSLCIGLCGETGSSWKDKSREMDFFDLKGIVENLFVSLGIKDYTVRKTDSFAFRDAMSARIEIGTDVIGTLGQVKQEIAKKFDIKTKVYVAEMEVEALLKYASIQKRFEPLPRYPSVRRDISILIDDNVSASEIYNVIREEGNQLVKKVEIFDLYKGQQIEHGKKSLSYAVEYRSDERTLKDEEVTEIHKNIQKALIKKLGAQIR